MSKPSGGAPASTSKLPTKSAWAKGPPQSTQTSSRSQSPSPAPVAAPAHHRRPSNLSQGVTILRGGNTSAIKPSSLVTFGSIDDDSAPISSSPAAAPILKSENVKSFGSVPVPPPPANGKPPQPSKDEIKRLFQGSSDTSARSYRTVPPPRPPSSPSYPRPNTNGARPPPPQNSAPSAMSSPRMAPHPGPPQSVMPPPMPIQQMSVPGWPGYYYPDQQQWYPWYPPPGPQMPGPPPHPPHNGIPMSPHAQPPPLQPGTPTQAHAVPSNIHPPHQPPHSHSHTPSTGNMNFTSPPPTPSTATSRLSATSSTFIPGRSSKIVLKNADGLEVDINSITKSTAATASASPSPGRPPFRQPSPSSPAPTPRRPTSIRLETEEQRVKRLAEEDKVKAEAEAKARKEKEEEEEKRRKEEERIKEEEKKLEEEQRKIKEEEQRKQREEEERKQREEEERKAKEEAERKAKEEEVRKAKEEEERKAKEEEEKRQKEEERIRQEAEAERLRLEEEAKAKAEAEQAAAAAAATPEEEEDGEVVEEPEEQPPAPREALRISTADLPKKPRPGALNLEEAKVTNEKVSAPLPSALSMARSITDFDEISYPAGIRSPDPSLNRDPKNGPLRYDREFLMQFIEVCKEKPEGLPDLDAIGLEPNSSHAQENYAMSRGGSGRHKNSSASAPSRQSSLGLGIALGKSGQSMFPTMGNFGSGSRLTTSDERFAAATRAVSGGAPYGRPSPMTRTSSQGGVGGTPMSRDRVRSKRGEKRGEGNKAGRDGYGHGQGNATQALPADFVPLEVSANRWDRKAMGAKDDKVAIVDRKVKALLNKLTMEKFDSISDQIVAWANKSEEENDGKTLMQVIGLVFDKATDEATWSEMYARLCRKMMESLSPSVRDESIKLSDGKAIAGGQLFRKYLLNRCQDEFEHGWAVKEATAAAAAKKAEEDQAVKAANEKEGGTEVALYSDEYYAAQKAKRRGLGLIKFIGELFKLQMLTERIMHTCLKKLLGNVDQPEEEDLESCCKLLMTIGPMLDTPKAANHMMAYFSRITELRSSTLVSARVQFMLQDVLDLREKKWVVRNAVAAPSTIAQVHENAAKEKAAQEKDYTRQISMSRGGSRRGGNREDYQQVGSDGWTTTSSNASRAPSKAGDLSNFGKINKNTSMTFGPSSVFSKKGGETKRESVSRSSSSSNMFSMLSQGDVATPEPKAPEPQRKRLVLAPRTKPTADEAAAKSEDEAEVEVEVEAESEPEASLSVEMNEEQADKKIAEDLKEFFAVRNLDEAEVYLTSLPAVHHFRLIDKFTSRAVESKEAEATLLAEFFTRAVEKELVTSEAFEAGFLPIAEIIDDITIDAPKAFSYFAMVVKSAGLDDERKTRLATKSLDEQKLLGLLS